MSVVGDTQCVAISIIDDSELEGNEAFVAEVAITMVGNEREIVQSSLITIVDDDGMFMDGIIGTRNPATNTTFS